MIYGSEILITLDEPLSKKPQRKFDVLKGKVKISKDFDRPTLIIQKDFLDICQHPVRS